MKKSIAALAAFLVAFTPNLVMAQATPNAPSTIPRYDNGTNFVPGKTDADGIMRVTEEYPYQLQNDVFPASDTTATVINGVLRPLGLGWSVSPFGARTVTFTRVQAGPSNTLKLYLFGSDDNVNYYPIVSSDAWVRFPGVGVSVADTVRVDTLMVTIPTQFLGGPNTVKTFKLTLPEDIYPGRYVQIWATRTDSAFATNTMKLSHTYEGRWK